MRQHACAQINRVPFIADNQKDGVNHVSEKTLDKQIKVWKLQAF